MNPKLKYRLGNLTKDNIGQVRKLLEATLPVTYDDKFYKDLLKPENSDITKLLFHSDVIVGAVCSRFQEGSKIYVMTLTVLSSYRNYGFGTKCLQMVVEAAKKCGTITEVVAHVQVSNENALKFYKKFGFEVVGRVDNYYKPEIMPRDAMSISYKIQ